MMMLIDQQERQKAADPNLSCIVQAPAGSGKTEILTQRFLRLLGQVEKPEHIVALTFTRKAANEMRERIIHALTRAASEREPELPHQQATYRYAKAALIQDQKHQWQLLQLPNRLRIMTIDALCQSLAHAIPLQDKQTPYAQITDNPHLLYQRAAQACFQHALEDSHYHAALTLLLTHFDNRVDYVCDILTEQLSTRDQWLPLLYQARLQEKNHFEQALFLIESHEIERFKMNVPPSLRLSLCELARKAAQIENNPLSPRFILQQWGNFENLDRTMIRALANLLLTSQATLRKSFDHHVGLRKEACDASTYKQIKEESKDLLQTLAAHPSFLEALLRVRQLPPPLYPDSEWQILQALFTLLPLLAAHLQLVFDEENAADFSAIATLAASALKIEEGPTDLALYLDNTIHHLLIDEFQDTSIQQFELIRQLVEGFDQEKTLFLVGDPMQSIYRFRNAEVGLFLRAKHQGIGPVKLTFLQLQSNFRSNATLVHWINQCFQTIFPAQNDLELGAIQFHPAIPIHVEHPHAFIKTFQYPTKQAEAMGLMELIHQELMLYPHDQIAILVRSRGQLKQLIRTLREHQIAYQGVDIDWLAMLPHIRDVWSLTQSLLMPGHRLAWISFLRSPWCGLSLADLHHLANINRKRSIYYALSQEDTYAGLSTAGKKRAQSIFSILNQAIMHRMQHRLSEWILQTLQIFNIAHLLTFTEHQDLEQFFLLLDAHEQQGQIADWGHFKSALNELYSKQMTPAKLQIMTIHKAKGLEFDCVILPSLSAKTKQMDKPLLRWLTLPTEQDPLVLVSPVKALAQEKCELYDYLTQIEGEKEHYEQQRLFYVAATRAKNRLYLTDSSESKPAGSFKAFLKEPFETVISASEESAEVSLPLLQRLPERFYEDRAVPSSSTHSVRFILEDHFARLIGITTHELLQWICTYHPQTPQEIPWNLSFTSLKQKGLTQTQIETALHKMRGYILPLFESPRGLWLISPHQDEKNEYAILIHPQHQDIQTRIIDRTFYDNGIRWIIDFKTGLDDKQQTEKHRAQVEEYAQYLALETTTSIRCGLFYLHSQHWVEWESEVSVGQV